MATHDNSPEYLSVFDVDASIRGVNDYIATQDITKKVRFSPKKIGDVRDFFSVPPQDREVILCSVRNQEGSENDVILEHIAEQKEKGILCYYPLVHNFQKDDYKGLVICNTMRFVIKNSGKVRVFYNPLSEGTKFDLGISLYAKVVRGLDLDLRVMPGFEPDDFFKYLNKMNKDRRTLEAFLDRHEDIFGGDKVLYEHVLGSNGKMTPEGALRFGMVFGSGMPFEIVNWGDAVKASDMEKDVGGNPISKSYTKVALLLHDIYNPSVL